MKRWAMAFGQLGVLLVVIGAGPAVAFAVFAPTANAMIPVMLSLTVAPLGALSLLTAAIMWVIYKVQS